MRLLRFYLRAETAELHRNNVRLRVIGDRDGLAPDIVTLIEGAEDLTRSNDKITVVIVSRITAGGMSSHVRRRDGGGFSGARHPA